MSKASRPKRPIIKIEVSPQAKAVIAELADKLGMTEVGLASRVYIWFSDAPDILQRAILKVLPPELEVDIAKMALERLAAGKHKDKH